jgi:hypothetical protein
MVLNIHVTISEGKRRSYHKGIPIHFHSSCVAVCIIGLKLFVNVKYHDLWIAILVFLISSL